MHNSYIACGDFYYLLICDQFVFWHSDASPVFFKGEKKVTLKKKIGRPQKCMLNYPVCKNVFWKGCMGEGSIATQ